MKKQLVYTLVIGLMLGATPALAKKRGEAPEQPRSLLGAGVGVGIGAGANVSGGSASAHTGNTLDLSGGTFLNGASGRASSNSSIVIGAPYGGIEGETEAEEDTQNNPSPAPVATVTVPVLPSVTVETGVAASAGAKTGAAATAAAKHPSP